MHRPLIIILFFFGMFNAQAQSYLIKRTLNKVTINQANQTLVFFTEPVKHDITPQQNKIYTWYSANQINATQGGYSGKLLNGLYTAYYLSKNLSQQGVFKNGLHKGSWKQWYSNGNLKEIINWKAGIKTGHFKQFNDKGEITQTGNYTNGLLNGKITTYLTKDSITVNRYKKGLVIPETQEAHTGIFFKIKTFFKKLLPHKKLK